MGRRIEDGAGGHAARDEEVCETGFHMLPRQMFSPSIAHWFIDTHTPVAARLFRLLTRIYTPFVAA